jgi:hypothetical protein
MRLDVDHRAAAVNTSVTHRVLPALTRGIPLRHKAIRCSASRHDKAARCVVTGVS